MKRTLKISILSMGMLFLFSCGMETYVVNTVHEDGSVTRKVTMKSEEREIDPADYRVPVDSTWKMEYSYEFMNGDDTTWILTARKEFESVEEINNDYSNDEGSNKLLNRSACFSKRFRWFTTVYRYSERIDRVLNVETPISGFLSEEEVKFFYLPEKIQNKLREGEDSVRYEAMSGRIEDKTEEWMFTALVRQYIEIFYNLAAGDPGLVISRGEMNAKTGEIVKMLMDSNEEENASTEEYDTLTEKELLAVADSLETAESQSEEDDELAELIVRLFGADFYEHFKPVLDSTENRLDEMAAPFWEADDYNMEIRMPGRIIASSGYGVTGSGNGEVTGVIWSVDGGYFLCQDYEMWVESRVNNILFWILSALFVAFVLSGVILSVRKRRPSA